MSVGGEVASRNIWAVEGPPVISDNRYQNRYLPMNISCFKTEFLKCVHYEVEPFKIDAGNIGVLGHV